MNNKDLTLVILAAGMGSRFGGLKQIEKFGPNGEFLTDYSIYDAIQAGFTKVVFIIKEENLELFKETIGKRIEKHIPVEYAFQKMDDIPAGFSVPEGREKPWGTAHAVYCARNVVHENFVIINADDFYGRDAFVKVSNFLKNADVVEGKESYGLVGYLVQNTLTENGAVKRGVCSVNDEYLDSLVESSIEEKDGKIIATPLDGSPSFEVLENSYVSMNMLGFSPKIFSYIEDNMTEFFENNKDSLDKCEFLIPDILTKSIVEEKSTVKVIPTTAKWIGVTYKEDKDPVIASINKLIEEGVYAEKLWED